MANNIFILTATFFLITFQVNSASTKIYIPSIKRNLYIQNDKHIEFSNKNAIIKKGAATIIKTKSYNALSKNRINSPIFTASPRGGGTKRALPGGAIVTFIDDMRDTDIRNWAKLEGYQIIKHHSRKSIWIVKTTAGIKCLNIVQKLNEDRNVKSAKPNWWISLQKK